MRATTAWVFPDPCPPSTSTGPSPACTAICCSASRVMGGTRSWVIVRSSLIRSMGRMVNRFPGRPFGLFRPSWIPAKARVFVVDVGRLNTRGRRYQGRCHPSRAAIPMATAWTPTRRQGVKSGVFPPVWNAGGIPCRFQESANIPWSPPREFYVQASRKRCAPVCRRRPILTTLLVISRFRIPLGSGGNPSWRGVQSPEAGRENRGMGAANVRAMVVEIFSELVNRGRLGPVNNLRCREAIVVQQRVRNKRGSNGRGYQRHALTTQREPASECWRPRWPLRPGSGGGLLLEQREHAPGQAG